MTETFEPGELFIYRKAPGVYELGVVRRQRDDRTYFCYYSMGDTAAATPAPLMHKLVNAKWAPIQWSNVWVGPAITVGDLLKLVPGGQRVFISDSDDNGEGPITSRCSVTRDYVVAREIDIDIRYEPSTDRVFLVDTFTGELMVLKAETLEEACDTIATMRKSGI